MPLVRVGKFVTRDGTVVRAHMRWPPGARRQLVTFVALFTIAVGVGASNGGGASRQPGDGGQRPRPQQTGVYPVHFPGWETPKRPSPTVSYPIRFD